MPLLVVITLLLLTAGTRADYACVCNYNTELAVLSAPDIQSTTVGRMYEFDCKPRSDIVAPSGFLVVQFEKQIGYIKIDDQVQIQTCSGDASPDDLFPTTTTTLPLTTSTRPPITTRTRTTVPITSTSTIASPKTYKTTTRLTTRTTTRLTPETTVRLTTTVPLTTLSSTPRMTTAPQITTTKIATPMVTTTRGAGLTTPSIIKDHLEVCPDHVQADVNLKGGFLGQYGDFCFEVVNWLRPFDAAESHCKITSGHLVAITNQNEQDYISDLMARNNFVNSSWIGLNDKDGEGVYTWTSGAPLTYKNFKGEFNSHSTQDHKLNDCFVMKQGGEWSDIPCGLSLSFLGIGEQHPFICQYNVSAKLQSLFEIIPEFVG